MDYFQLETSLKESISPIDELAFYRKRSEIVKTIESKIRGTSNAFLKRNYMSMLEEIKKETPESVMWRERSVETKAKSAIDTWENI
ncbi:hypothetical protein [Bdellovibrio sp. HCB209]|uniref:hypothetical protein n=1 Tax=Bdellovibrio sp. HCB209 TaxID=3394354 RepID=UPI0039B45D61